EGGKDQGRRKRMIVVVGPWGGNGGSYWDDGSYNGVREISLAYGRCIDSICVVYDKNGKPVAAEKHGGVGGNRTAEITLQYPEEFLTSVSGHYCPVVHGGTPVIRSLTFMSNRRTFGPYGVEEGTPFSFSTDGALIVGFKGRSGWYLDAVGFHLSHVQTTKLYQTVQSKLKKLISTASRSSAMKDGEEH
ncbi:Jacalin-related lectin like, partial [Actinidia chinensis var. chinensis]